jgi:uncharacterized protein YjdB
MARILLVDSRIADRAVLECASVGKSIYVEVDYEHDGMFELLKKIMDSCPAGERVERIAFAQHGTVEPGLHFTAKMGPFLVHNMQLRGLAAGYLPAFFQALAKIGVQHFDFLVCSLLEKMGVAELLRFLQEDSGILFGASTGLVGSEEAGGSWMMHNDVDVRAEYFTEAIAEFKGVFGEPAIGVYAIDGNFVETAVSGAVSIMKGTAFDRVGFKLDNVTPNDPFADRIMWTASSPSVELWNSGISTPGFITYISNLSSLTAGTTFTITGVYQTSTQELDENGQVIGSTFVNGATATSATITIVDDLIDINPVNTTGLTEGVDVQLTYTINGSSIYPIFNNNAPIWNLYVTGGNYMTEPSISNTGLLTITSSNLTLRVTLNINGAETEEIITIGSGSGDSNGSGVGESSSSGDIPPPPPDSSGTGGAPPPPPGSGSSSNPGIVATYSNVVINGSQTPTTLYSGQSYTISVVDTNVPNPGVGSGLRVGTPVWSSSAPSVATVDSSTGVITIISAGTVTFTATDATSAFVMGTLESVLVSMDSGAGTGAGTGSGSGTSSSTAGDGTGGPAPSWVVQINGQTGNGTIYVGDATPILFTYTAVNGGTTSWQIVNVRTLAGSPSGSTVVTIDAAAGTITAVAEGIVDIIASNGPGSASYVNLRVEPAPTGSGTGVGTNTATGVTSGTGDFSNGTNVDTNDMGTGVLTNNTGSVIDGTSSTTGMTTNTGEIIYGTDTISGFGTDIFTNTNTSELTGYATHTNNLVDGTGFLTAWTGTATSVLTGIGTDSGDICGTLFSVLPNVAAVYNDMIENATTSANLAALMPQVTQLERVERAITAMAVAPKTSLPAAATVVANPDTATPLLKTTAADGPQILGLTNGDTGVAKVSIAIKNDAPELTTTLSIKKFDANNQQITSVVGNTATYDTVVFSIDRSIKIVNIKYTSMAGVVSTLSTAKDLTTVTNGEIISLGNSITLTQLKTTDTRRFFTYFGPFSSVSIEEVAERLCGWTAETNELAPMQTTILKARILDPCVVFSTGFNVLRVTVTMSNGVAEKFDYITHHGVKTNEIWLHLHKEDASGNISPARFYVFGAHEPRMLNLAKVAANQSFSIRISDLAQNKEFVGTFNGTSSSGVAGEVMSAGSLLFTPSSNLTQITAQMKVTEDPMPGIVESKIGNVTSVEKNEDSEVSVMLCPASAMTSTATAEAAIASNPYNAPSILKTTSHYPIKVMGYDNVSGSADKYAICIDASAASFLNKNGNTYDGFQFRLNMMRFNGSNSRVNYEAYSPSTHARVVLAIPTIYNVVKMTDLINGPNVISLVLDFVSLTVGQTKNLMFGSTIKLLRTTDSHFYVLFTGPVGALKFEKLVLPSQITDHGFTAADVFGSTPATLSAVYGGNYYTRYAAMRYLPDGNIAVFSAGPLFSGALNPLVVTVYTATGNQTKIYRSGLGWNGQFYFIYDASGMRFKLDTGVANDMQPAVFDQLGLTDATVPFAAYIHDVYQGTRYRVLWGGVDFAGTATALAGATASTVTIPEDSTCVWGETAPCTSNPNFVKFNSIAYVADASDNDMSGAEFDTLDKVETTTSSRARGRNNLVPDAMLAAATFTAGQTPSPFLATTSAEPVKVYGVTPEDGVGKMQVNIDEVVTASAKTVQLMVRKYAASGRRILSAMGNVTTYGNMVFSVPISYTTVNIFYRDAAGVRTLLQSGKNLATLSVGDSFSMANEASITMRLIQKTATEYVFNYYGPFSGPEIVQPLGSESTGEGSGSSAGTGEGSGSSAGTGEGSGSSAGTGEGSGSSAGTGEGSGSSAGTGTGSSISTNPYADDLIIDGITSPTPSSAGLTIEVGQTVTLLLNAYKNGVPTRASGVYSYIMSPAGLSYGIINGDQFTALQPKTGITITGVYDDGADVSFQKYFYNLTIVAASSGTGTGTATGTSTGTSAGTGAGTGTSAGTSAGTGAGTGSSESTYSLTMGPVKINGTVETAMGSFTPTVRVQIGATAQATVDICENGVLLNIQPTWTIYEQINPTGMYPSYVEVATINSSGFIQTFNPGYISVRATYNANGVFVQKEFRRMHVMTPEQYAIVQAGGSLALSGMVTSNVQISGLVMTTNGSVNNTGSTAYTNNAYTLSTVSPWTRDGAVVPVTFVASYYRNTNGTMASTPNVYISGTTLIPLAPGKVDIIGVYQASPYDPVYKVYYNLVIEEGTAPADTYVVSAVTVNDTSSPVSNAGLPTVTLNVGDTANATGTITKNGTPLTVTWTTSEHLDANGNGIDVTNAANYIVSINSTTGEIIALNAGTCDVLMYVLDGGRYYFKAFYNLAVTAPSSGTGAGSGTSTGTGAGTGTSGSSSTGSGTGSSGATGAGTGTATNVSSSGTSTNSSESSESMPSSFGVYDAIARDIYIMGNDEQTIDVNSNVTFALTLDPTSYAGAITWTSSNPSVLSFPSASSGYATTGSTPGTVTVTATLANGFWIKDKFTVRQPVTGITEFTVAAGQPYLNYAPVGAEFQITTSVIPSTATESRIRYVSIRPEVATVSSTGYVRCLTLGSTSIYAVTRDGGFSTYNTIYVIEPSIGINNITITPNTTSVSVGGKLSLRTTAIPSNWATGAVKFTSSNPAIATITEWGNLVGVAKGTVTITAATLDNLNLSNSDLYKQVNITVVQPVTGISNITGATSVIVGNTTQLSASVVPVDASVTGLIWSATPSGIVEFVDASGNPNNSTGLVKGLAAGSVTITAASIADPTKVSAGYSFDVQTGVVALSGIDISGAAAAFVGQATTFTAVFTPADASNKSVTWSIDNSNPLSATGSITSSGVATATSTGNLVVKAVSNANSNISATKSVTITEATVTSMTDISGAASIPIGGNSTYTATVSPAFANQTITWSTDNSGVATVNSSGVVTGVSFGTVTLTARSANPAITKTRSILIGVAVTGVNDVTVSGSTTLLSGGSIDVSSSVIPANASVPNLSWSIVNLTITGVTGTFVASNGTAGTAGTITFPRGGVYAVRATSVSDPTKMSAIRFISVNDELTSLGPITGATSGAVNQTMSLIAAFSPPTAIIRNLTWTVEADPEASVGGTATIMMLNDSYPENGLLRLTGEGRVRVRVSNPVQPSIVSDYYYFDISGKAVRGISAVSALPVATTTDHYVNIQADDASNCTVRFTATTNPADATNNAITWSLLDQSNQPLSSSIATIDASGILTALQAGHTITVRATAVDTTLGTYSATYAKKIKTIRPIKIITDLSSSTGIYTVNVTAPSLTLTPVVDPSDASVKQYVWSSSDTTVANVTQSGVVTRGSNGGTATITAAYALSPDVSGSRVVTNYIPLTNITVNSSKNTFIIGANVTDAQLTATVSPSTATIKTVTWSSDNTAVCTIDASGNLIPVSGGVANITATTTDPNSLGADGNPVKRTVQITIAIPVTDISGITSAGNRTQFSLDPIQLSTEVIPANASNKTITWSSSSTTIARVDASGVVFPAGTAGTATITATSEDGGFTETFTVGVSYSTNYAGTV